MSEINLVKQAICRGYRTTQAIVQATGLSESSTKTYLTRLQHRNLVVASKSPDPVEWSKSIKHFHMIGVGFLLQDIWGRK